MTQEIIDIDTAYERLKSLNTKIADDLASWLYEDEFEEAEVTWYEGDTEIDVFKVEQITIVNGNLSVNNYITDAAGNWDITYFGVTGNVECPVLHTHALGIIGGNLTAEEYIYANSLCDYYLLVYGDIKTSVIANCGHSITSKKVITMKGYVNHNAISDSNQEFARIQYCYHLQDYFIPDVLEVEGAMHNLDLTQLEKYALAKRSALLDDIETHEPA